MTPDLLAAYLINAAWQVPLVALIAVLVSRASEIAPRDRNTVWLVFLAAAALLPAVSLDDLLPRAAVTVVRLAPAALAKSPAAVIPPLAQVDAPALQLAPWMAWVMAGVCAAVALALLARLAVAALAARRLVRGAEPVAAPAEVLRAIQQFAQAHGRAAPPILSTPAVASPAVVGVLRPVILLPRRLTADRTELRAALLHEMAHVVRHDYAMNLACELLTLPVAWHPALLALKTGVRRSRERACDAMAAEAMASRKTYARCLLSLAQTLGDRSQSGCDPSATRQALAVGLFGRGDLEDRLMQLIKSRHAEGPLVTVARLGGLAAVSAGLLGSLALLHVTPVFAQAVSPAPAPPAGAASPAPSAAASTAVQAEQDAAKPAAPHHRSGIIYSNHGAIISTGHAGHTHTWTTAAGQPITIINDDPGEFTAEQRAHWEAEARDAEARAAKAEAMVNSPEFKARIADAEKRAAEAEKLVNSAEFKARIAEAQRRGAEAEKMVNSAEFKARIAEAQARGAEAERRVHSPEFRARLERARGEMQAAGVRLQREIDDLKADDERAAAKITP